MTNEIKQNYRFSYDAPFALNIEQLEKIFDCLDKSSMALKENIADYKKEVEAKARKLYSSEVYSAAEREKNIRDYYELKGLQKEACTITALFDDLSGVNWHDCKDIRSNLSSVNKELRRLRIRVEGIGSEYIEIEIDKNRETIDIDANPNGNQEITRSFAVLHDLIKDNYPSKLKRVWKTFYPASVMLAFFVLWVTFFMSVTKIVTDTTKQDLYKLVSDTKKAIDTTEVIRLMAIIESGNSDVKVEYHGFTSKMIIYIVLSVSFAAIMIYKPRLTLEIGKNKGEYKFREKYENAVLYVVPGYLIVTFALPWMNDVITKLFS